MNFWFIDQILEFEYNRRLLAVRCVTNAEDYFKDHFPTRHIMPGALIVEAFAQVGTALLELSRSLQVKAIPLLVERVRFRTPVIPGDRMMMSGEIVSLHDDAAQARFEARVQDNKLVSDGEITFRLLPAAEVYTTPAVRDYLKTFYRRSMVHTKVLSAPPGGMGFLE
jgi:3-hydroxyacyl-[acyl-carrier-protein] dehydratase